MRAAMTATLIMAPCMMRAFLRVVSVLPSTSRLEFNVMITDAEATTLQQVSMATMCPQKRPGITKNTFAPSATTSTESAIVSNDNLANSIAMWFKYSASNGSTKLAEVVAGVHLPFWP
mmetsp:Transcript_42358/g.76883  ORF Transcript_42358/g.76883 Transcript_42358/m.76883 type:complete len:118 (-) Transcript_42358:49-402(-)